MTCLLADEQNTTPSAVHQWSSKDRVLMLAWFQAKAEAIKEMSGK
jgi:hypothetical protein